MTVIRHCEVCEQPIPDGQEIVHPEEGDSYCARCVVDLIGAERDALTRQLAGAVEALRVLDVEAIRDPAPHSSAWLVPAGAMDLVRAALRGQ